MANNKVIVFGNAMQGGFGLARSFGENGHPVDFVLEPCKKSECGIRFSRNVSKIHFLDALEDAIDVLLREYGNEKEKPVIYCSSDTAIAFLDANYDRVKDHFYVFNARGEQGRIGFYLEKTNTFDIAAESGLELIKTWVVCDKCDISDDIVYPCFVKGVNSGVSGKDDTHICNSNEELETCIRPGVKLLVQEYVQKDYEGTVVGVSFNHGKDVVVKGVIRKVRESFKRMGEYMRLDDIECHKGLNIDGIKNLVSKMGYEGMFSVDYMRKGDKFYFLEVNLRNDGLAYMYTAAGVNYPYLWYLYCIGELTEDYVSKLKLKTPFYVMHENDMYNIVEGKVSLVQWCKDFAQTDAFFTMNWRDPLPFVFSCCIHARQLFKKIFKYVFCRK